jgi:2-oxoglutarate dehydrogenase E1 component
MTMGYEGLDFDDIAGGVSPAFVETLYRRYKADPTGIEAGLARLVRGTGEHGAGPELGEPALAARRDRCPHRRARPDPDGAGAQARQGRCRGLPPRPAARAASEADIAKAAGDSIRAMLLIRTYRVRGHLAANLDPLGLVRRTCPRT